MNEENWKMIEDTYSKEHQTYRKIDFFIPHQAKNEICLLFIHGGGFVGGNKESWHAVAAHFASLGYTTASAGYRLAPEYPFPAQIEDVRLAMQHVKRKAGEYGYRAEQVVVIGSSAGGHLSLMLATIDPADPLGQTEELLLTDTLPKAVVGYCPVTTMSLERDFILSFMGGTREEKAEAYQAASPVDRVKEGVPPLLLLQGDADTTTPLELVQELHERWQESGGDSTMHIYPGIKHGFGYGVKSEAQKQSLGYIEQFLNELKQPTNR